MEGGIVQNDRGQALTEFAIVIPVVLLFFLTMLQYFEVIRAAQLGKYAAFIAARVYAVREPVDGADKAKDYATKAAAMALSPVARLVPGEVAGIGGSVSSLVPGGVPGILSEAVELVEGYAVAYYVRLGSTLGFGKVEVTKGGTPESVNVTINYPQPVYLPGLAELWSFIGGEGIYSSMKTSREGLGGVPGALLTAAEVYDSNKDLAEQLAGSDLPEAWSVSPLFPYVNVRSKCSIGHEPWGSKDPEYRPRKHSTVKDSETSAEDQEKLNKIDDTQQAAKDYQDAVNNERAKCQAWNDARAKLKAAQSKYDNTPANPPQPKQQALNELNQAKSEEQAAREAYYAARSNRQSKQATLEGLTGQSYGDLNCEE